MAGIGSLQDVLALESTPWTDEPSASTYSLIEHAARQWGNAPALSFFMDMQTHRKPVRWSYRDLFHSINQTANAFRHLGVTRQDTVAYILPNLPETHLTIWGGQAAGRVAALGRRGADPCRGYSGAAGAFRSKVIFALPTLRSASISSPRTLASSVWAVSRLIQVASPIQPSRCNLSSATAPAPVP